MLFSDMRVSGENCRCETITQHTTLKPQPSEVRDEKWGKHGKEGEVETRI